MRVGGDWDMKRRAATDKIDGVLQPDERSLGLTMIATAIRDTLERNGRQAENGDSAAAHTVFPCTETGAVLTEGGVIISKSH